MSEAAIRILGPITSLYGDTGNDPSRINSRSQNAEAGSHIDFETLLRLFHKRIYNLTYRLLGDPDEAADLVQETFVRAYRAYPKFQGDVGGVYPWLCQITVNGCKNKFRDMSRRNRYEGVSLDGQIEGEDSSFDFQMGDESGNPAGLLEQRELEERVHEAIQSLHPDYRVVVVLRDLHGLSYKEIAESTGLTLETVKARLFRARAALKRRLTPYIEE